MALLKHVELVPQNEKKLNEYLYREIQNQVKWRNNRSDTVNDQTNFYESYFGKESFIDKNIMSKFLKESEKIHLQNLNHNNLEKTKFLEIMPCHSYYDKNPKDYEHTKQALFSYDNDDKELNIIELSLETNGYNEEDRERIDSQEGIIYIAFI